MKRCIYCAKDYPLIHFRRYTYGKLREMSSCNTCRPPKTLKQMTRREREQALLTSHRNVSPVVVDRINANKEREGVERIKRKAYNRRRTLRIDAWNNAILKQARVEYRWAYATHLRYKTKLKEQPDNLQRKPFVEFFEEYCRVMKRLVESVEVLVSSPTAPTNPSEEQKNPLTYVDPLEHGYLKDLYAKCVHIPGTRPAREPWFLYWRK